MTSDYCQFAFDEIDDELTDLLLEISNYEDDDFVIGILILLKSKNEKQKVIEYIYTKGTNTTKREVVDVALAIHRMRKY